MANRRFRVAGLVAAGVVLMMSMGLVVASKSPSRLKAMSAQLPAAQVQALDVPLLRSLPEPLKGTVGAPARQVRLRGATARR